MQVTPVNSNLNQTNTNYNKNKERKIKAGVVATSALGVATALAHISKRQGFSLNPSRIAKTPIKDWAIFSLYSKNHPDRKLVHLEGAEVIELASASVAGGLIGGLVFDDKKHRKAKYKEAINQLLGNVLAPIGCVSLAGILYQKQEKNILNLVPQIKETGKASRFFNAALKAVPGSIATIAALGTGIFVGNKVSNFINEKIYHKKVERNIKPSDFAPHVDDLGVAITLMAKESPFSSFIQRVVPAFLCVPGYEIGMHREEPEIPELKK